MIISTDVLSADSLKSACFKVCCEMSDRRIWPLRWLYSSHEIQVNVAMSLVALTIIMVCAEHKVTAQCGEWKAGKQLKSILCRQMSPGE